MHCTPRSAQGGTRHHHRKHKEHTQQIATSHTPRTSGMTVGRVVLQDFFFFFCTIYLDCSAAFAFCCFLHSFLHSLLCPPSLQCFLWHAVLQYRVVRHRLHLFNLRSVVSGVPQVEQRSGAGVVRVGLVFPSS